MVSKIICAVVTRKGAGDVSGSLWWSRFDGAFGFVFFVIAENAKAIREDEMKWNTKQCAVVELVYYVRMYEYKLNDHGGEQTESDEQKNDWIYG